MASEILASSAEYQVPILYIFCYEGRVQSSLVMNPAMAPATKPNRADTLVLIDIKGIYQSIDQLLTRVGIERYPEQIVKSKGKINVFMSLMWLVSSSPLNNTTFTHPFKIQPINFIQYHPSNQQLYYQLHSPPTHTPLMKLKPSFQKRRTAYSLNTKTVRTIKDSISDLELSSFGRGFNPFSQTSLTSTSHTAKDLAFFKITDSQEPSKSDIKIMLQGNKAKLGVINKKVSEKRQEEYESFISNNSRYCKLLELNNIRSKIMTSLKSNVGEIVIKLIEEHKPEDYEYVAEFSKIPSIGWKPESREGQCCVVYKDSMYLIGGHNSNPLGDVSVYNFKEGTWSQMADTEVSRSYHTTLLYKQHYLIVFGGMSRYNTYYKSRDCLNSTLLFSPVTNGAKYIKIENQHIVEPRRSHSACIVGKQMLVFGGINMFKSYLRDMVYLDFRELKWVELEYHIESSELEEFLGNGIAKHAMISNFQSRQGHCKLYSKDYAAEEGIFVFGGTNQIGLRSVLFQISLKRRVPRLQKLHPSGYLPSGVSPIISRVSNNVIAVISGERTEREMKLYKIKQNEFLGVHYHNQPCELGGIGSSLVKYNDQMYVLFGVGEKGYIGTISNFKVEQKLKSQAEKEGKKPKRQSFVHKDFRILPTFTQVETGE